jgi:hypothetical protein
MKVEELTLQEKDGGQPPSFLIVWSKKYLERFENHQPQYNRRDNISGDNQTRYICLVKNRRHFLRAGGDSAGNSLFPFMYGSPTKRRSCL